MTAPPSKSMAHRLLICAALAEGTSVIRNIELSQDILATIDCLKALGADISCED
jgi:3-phosphoshikimate 1-carboxyvinyltransferase